MPRRVLPLLAALAALAGCGGDAKPAADLPPIRLSISSPQDATVVRDDTVEIQGRVSPTRASVSVLGKPVAVSGGAFSTQVELEEGDNVIDVAASMPGRSPAFAALRVDHDPRVTVPDLTGLSDDDASHRLSALGLDPNVTHTGGLFDDLHAGPRRVCDSDPPPGTRLEPGTEVNLLVAKTC